MDNYKNFTATVGLISVETNEVRKALMNISGVISFLQILGSQYKLSKEKTGFSIKTEDVAKTKKLTKSR